MQIKRLPLLVRFLNQKLSIIRKSIFQIAMNKFLFLLVSLAQSIFLLPKRKNKSQPKSTKTVFFFPKQNTD